MAGRSTTRIWHRGPVVGGSDAVFVAAGTARGSGGRIVVQSVAAWMTQRGRRGVVTVPADYDLSTFPQGPRYRRLARARAVASELLGVHGPNTSVYVGMSDRLPLLRRARLNVMVAQDDLLYGPRTAHASTRQRLRHRVLRLWARLSLRRADWVVTPTEATRSAVVSTGLVEAERVVSRSIPPQVAGARKQEQRAVLERVVMIGDIYEFKRFDWAVRAIDRWAARNGRTVEVVHIGRPYEESAIRSLQEAAASCRQVSVCILGPLDHATTMAELAQSDLLVFPSTRESFGIPLAEALAVGVPAVCRDLAQFREVAGDAARYFAGDGDGLVAALDDCLDRSTRERMVERGSSRVTPDGAWDVFTPPVGVTAPAPRRARGGSTRGRRRRRAPGRRAGRTPRD